jgi:hypothetical protein
MKWKKQVSLYGANAKPDWFWKLNPTGQALVLACHGGAVIHADSGRFLDGIGNAVEDGSNIVPKTEQSIAHSHQMSTLNLL